MAKTISSHLSSGQIKQKFLYEALCLTTFLVRRLCRIRSIRLLKFYNAYAETDNIIAEKISQKCHVYSKNKMSKGVDIVSNKVQSNIIAIYSDCNRFFYQCAVTKVACMSL